jgi:hypothetical protein
MASNKAQTSAPAKRAPPPALNPESCALVQPWKDFIAKGYITELNVKFTPLGETHWCKVVPSLQKEEEGNADIPIGDAKTRIIAAGLWTPKVKEKGGDKKKEDLLPLRTLVKRDLEETDQKKLSLRIMAVAKALGDTTARGRIGSLKLMAEGVDTFEKWWEVANPAQKVRLLTDAKHFKEFTREEIAFIADSIPGCPFRGSVPTPTPEEDEEEKPVNPRKERSESPQSKNGN